MFQVIVTDRNFDEVVSFISDDYLEALTARSILARGPNVMRAFVRYISMDNRDAAYWWWVIGYGDAKIGGKRPLPQAFQTTYKEGYEWGGRQ